MSRCKSCVLARDELRYVGRRLGWIVDIADGNLLSDDIDCYDEGGRFSDERSAQQGFTFHWKALHALLAGREFAPRR